jgi:hypothetical protein
MKSTKLTCVTLLGLLATLAAPGQLPAQDKQDHDRKHHHYQLVDNAASPALPTLVSFSGVLTITNGKPISGLFGVTFFLYAEPQGGAPLWMETQNVQLDATGHYTVQLGSTSSQGLPPSLFATGEARWLEVQAQGYESPHRIMLMSGPYALKAADTEAIGGKPGSAFWLLPRVHGQAPTANLASPLPASTAETNCSGTGVSDDSDADHFLDSGFRDAGYCGEAAGKLTGYCMASLHVGFGCDVKRVSTCRAGAKAKKPGQWECCGFYQCNRVTVDLETPCNP